MLVIRLSHIHERLKNAYSLIFRDALWSNSNGIPTDVLQLKEHGALSEDVPESFATMIRELNNCNVAEDAALDPSERIFSDLITRCILHCQGVLLTAFLNKTKQSNHKAYVLKSLLENDSVIDQSKCEEIELKLFDLLPSSTLLQKTMYASPNVMSHLHPHSIIGHCCKFLRNSANTDYVMSAASTLLSHTIQKNAGQHSSEMVRALIESIGRDDSGKGDGSSKILKFSELWRKGLIEESPCNNDYSSFLQAICIEMFDQPSNSSIFSLFAGMIGEGNYDDVNDAQSMDRKRVRVSIATKNLITLCLHEYKKCQPLNKENKGDVFTVIAPSLLLRRIPYNCYKMLHNIDGNESLLENLSDILASKLGIETANSIVTAAEIGQERKLLAELVPRCLPFSTKAQNNDDVVHGFQRFCSPIFTSALAKIKQNSMQLRDWRMTKISLYICCHAIHLNPNSFSIKDFESMLAFVVETFQLEVISDDDMIELQTGCIDFLATCIESICTVSDVGYSKITLLEDSLNKSSSSTEQETLANLFKEVTFQIIQNAKPETKSHLFNGESASFSVATRTCVLNAFTTASKRCPQEKLIGLSEMIVSEILGWAIGGPIDNHVRHPLCLAAMMQCIFVLLTRSKSSTCLQTNEKSLESNLRDLFQLSVEAIKFNNENKSFDNYSISTMRVAAMKLLMGIISVHQTSTSSSSSAKFGFLAPGDIARATSIIRGTANVDKDPIVRKLAEHLVSVLVLH